MNRALCETLGYSEEEFSKLTILAVAHPDEVERIVQKAERHFITLRLQKTFWKRGSSPRAAESSGSDCINDVLDFSKIEAGKLEVEMADFHLQQGLGETLKALAFRAHQKGLELAWRVGPDIPQTLRGDVGRLRQVLVNLVGNSVKFTDRGEIVVSVEKEAEDASRITLHFQVRDTGIGIPKEKQQIIFHAFTQADSSATRRYGGTGLGLAITSRLVQLMGGRIWVQSEEGRGSTFHFTVRLAIAEQPDQPAVVSDQSLVANLPVLESRSR